jgi:hypothetical protein
MEPTSSGRCVGELNIVAQEVHGSREQRSTTIPSLLPL